MNVLIIGSGGREHVLTWKISQSSKCDQLYVIPGNAGTASIATNVDINPNELTQLKKFVLEHHVEMVVVGPEAPLVQGLVDNFEKDPELKDVMMIGPDQSGARLEGSKDFAKNFMLDNNIPTARSKTFTAPLLEDGYRFLEALSAPYVLKADGLAAGKGVLIIDNLEKAKTSLKEMLLDQKFGKASEKVVIEEYLSGIELSVFVLTDGSNYILLPEAKDYKRIGENDSGPNTGGMGAVSPVVFAGPEFLQKVVTRVIRPTIDGLKAQGIQYKGFIFIGLMNVNGDPYVIEYNVRMGDPEAQVVIPRINNDFVEVFSAVANKGLDKIALQIDPQTAITVVQVAGGYPDKYDKGKPITGLDQVKEALVFHAGTKIDADGQVVTNGGRVTALTCLAPDLNQAREKAYQAALQVCWDNIYYRKDIGKDLLNYKI
ncbi:MAG: phosphoribosylamine--glycine ligase [Candidatus Cyclobacteriaceae bacterium M3_2C_046]